MALIATHVRFALDVTDVYYAKSTDSETCMVSKGKGY